MADEKEKVVYEFQGDVSSLKKSTQDALDLLDKFQATMDQLNSDGIVKASQRAQAGFQNSMNKVSKGIANVQKKLSAVGDVRMPRGTEAFNATQAATATLASTLDELNSSNTVTSKSLNEMKVSLNAITSVLKSAGPSFDTLVSKEEKFQQRLETIGNVANKFSSKLYGATDRVKNTFTAMGASVGAKLNALGAKFEPLKAKIQGFKDKAVIAGNRVAQVFSTVAAAFRRTSDGTEGAARSQSKFSKVLDSIKEKLNKHNNQLKQTSDGYSQMQGSAGGAYSAMSAGAGALTAALGAIKNVVGGIVDSFFALAGVELGNLFSDGTKSAIDYVENLNLFEVAMGSSIDEGQAFVAQMQEVYGMDPSNIYRYTGYFYQLTDAIGMSEDASATMSLSMTKAANDLASLFNTDIQTVVDDLASGMQGMSRSVRKYGMDIRATTLQQTALKYGIEGEVESMSEANRQALRYITMLEQAQNALHQTTDAVDGTSSEMGDFARNIETPANQLRIFKEQMSQLGRAIGNFIVVPLQKALPYINGFVMALRVLVNFLATLAGVAAKSGSSLDSAGESAEDAADGVDSITESADDASKSLKQLLAPFDELNVLQDSGSDEELLNSDALDPALAAALAEMELNLENISMKANKVRDDILSFLGLTVTTDPITQEQIIQWDGEAFKTNVLDGLNKFKEWFQDLSPFSQGALAIGGVITILGVLGPVISGVVSAIQALVPAFQAVSTVMNLFTNPVFLVITSLALLLTNSKSFRTAFTDLFSKVGASIKEWGSILADVFTTVGKDITKMWDTHIQPTIQAIGDALAPALDTLGQLWNNLSIIVSDVFLLVGDLWTNVLKPALEGALEIIQDLCDIFEELWVDHVGPVVEKVGNSIEKMWTEKFKPAITSIINIIGKLIELIMALWNNVLKPIIDWLVVVFGPLFVGVFDIIWSAVEWVIGWIMNIINSLLTVLEGVIDFLTGVFTGDWKRAWMGIVNVFVGIGNLILDIFEGVINGIIWLLNSLIEVMWQALQALINVILGAIDGIAGILGFDLNLKLDVQVPDIPSVSIPRIPKMASGGVVTGPTHAIIGEGKYDEAVIPLGDSPQMNDLINKIAEAIDKDDPNPQPVEVKVYIGDREYDAYTYKASERGKKVVGKQPIKIGG